MPVRARLAANLAMAFPERSTEQIAALEMECRRLARLYASDQARLDGLPRHELVRHCVDDVTLTGGEHLRAALASTRAVVAFTPHYGNYPVASLRLAIEAQGKKPVNFFYNPPERNGYSSRVNRLFAMVSPEIHSILNGRAGAVKASRALARGELLGIMPDVADVASRSLFVPFLGCLAVAMAGTAHFALRSDAILLPTYCWRVAPQKYVMQVGAPLPLARGSTMDDSIWETTAAIFRDIESVIAVQPEHWSYWEDFDERVFPGIRLGRCRTTWQERLGELLRTFGGGHSPIAGPLTRLHEELRSSDGSRSVLSHIHRQR